MSRKRFTQWSEEYAGTSGISDWIRTGCQHVGPRWTSRGKVGASESSRIPSDETHTWNRSTRMEWVDCFIATGFGRRHGPPGSSAIGTAGARKNKLLASGGPNRRKDRTAMPALRCTPVDLLSPKNREDTPPIQMIAVSAREESPTWKGEALS